MRERQRPSKPKEEEQPPEPLVVRDDLEVNAQASETRGRPRCAYCHSDVLVAAMVCPGCATTLHQDCLRGKTCPTLGCQIPLREFGRLHPPPAPVRAPRLGPALAVVVLFLFVHGLWSLYLNWTSDGPRDRAWVERNVEDVDDLRRALSDPSPQIRFEVAQALGDLGPEARPALPELVGLLWRDGRQSRHYDELVEVLQRVDGPGAVDELSLQLTAREASLEPRGFELAPVRALCELGRRNGVGTTERAMATARALARESPSRAPELSLIVVRYRSEPYLDLLRLGLASADPALRERAAQTLGQVEDYALTGGVVEAMGHDDPQVRWHAVRVLEPGVGVAGFWEERLFLAADDASPKVRRAAVERLSAVGADYRERFLKVLGERVGDADPEVRAEASRLLARALGKKAYGRFVELLDAPRVEVRVEAARVLGAMGDRLALPRLREIANSKDEPRALRAAAIKAVKVLEARPRRTPLYH